MDQLFLCSPIFGHCVIIDSTTTVETYDVTGSTSIGGICVLMAIEHIGPNRTQNVYHFSLTCVLNST